jgi:hypothetical protein
MHGENLYNLNDRCPANVRREWVRGCLMGLVSGRFFRAATVQQPIWETITRAVAVG